MTRPSREREEGALSQGEVRRYYPVRSLEAPKSVVPTSSSAATDLGSTSVVLRGASGQDIVARVVDQGSGRPFVFLHGLVGLNDHWEEVVRRTKHRARCIMLEIPLLELRGPDCSVDGVTELTASFLRQALPGEPAVLVGNSFGGHVALRIALDYPDLVQALVLAGSSGLIERTMVKEITVRPSREWLSRKIGELFFDQSHVRSADLDRAHRELSDRLGARAMVQLSRSARKNHLGDRICEVRSPTLLIWGRNDIVTPPEAAAEFLERLPNARIVWFDRCGHAPMIEKAAEFAEALVEFGGALERGER